ncbi:MAG TPA: NYN domain-containing protein [Phototrophicaceae bacterium]|nr:NYN domain-containing protein [Phototrophicaceae bacterium]
METKSRFALLIDGDNAQAALLPQMLAAVSKHGTVTIRCVYGDWSKPQMKSWKQAADTYAMQTVQQFSYISGKNATDIALIIDAMDILHTAGVDGICIVSSDSDYTPLALRIREKNLIVIGIGRRETLRAFVNACNVFIYTENLTPTETAKTPEKPAAKTVKKATNATNGKTVDTTQLQAWFQKAFDSAVQDDGWAHLAAVGESLRGMPQGFDPRIYGHKQLSQLVKAYPNLFEIQKRPNKGGKHDIFIRLKGKKSPAKKTPAS